MLRVTIEGEEYMPTNCPKARTFDSNIYCDRDEGATLEMKIRFENQAERDKAFLTIKKLVGRDG